jgi:hypothetical protein
MIESGGGQGAKCPLITIEFLLVIWFLIIDNRYAWSMTPKSLPYKWDKALREDGKWYELSF